MKNFTRRDVIKAGLGLSAAPLVATPFLTYGAGEKPLRIGMHDPLTGTYAAEGESETRGAKMALAEINAKGGLLGRQVELLIEDEAAKAGLVAYKAHLLI